MTGSLTTESQQKACLQVLAQLKKRRLSGATADRGGGATRLLNRSVCLGAASLRSVLFLDAHLRKRERRGAQ